ncbi:MAG: trypsin-like peptidase domain-containing protein [Pseudomonadota bacterium]
MKQMKFENGSREGAGKTTPVSVSGARYRTGIMTLVLLIQVLFAGTVSHVPENMDKSLVSHEDPVFDKRFQELSFQDIDLKQMWVERKYSENREKVMVNNYTFADIADAAKDGVVNIYTRRLEEKEAKFGISPNDILPIRIPILSDIFDIIPFKVPIPYRSEGFSLGSGFIINEHGFILTNAHVIHNSTDIRVVLAGARREYLAKIIGSDRMTDTALIKIEPDHFLTALPLGSSDGLKIGEMVLAIGNPLGLEHSVTSGIVSAKGRIAPELNDKFVDFLQTDSAINPGNSGGPLLNLHGEVVGINTAVISKAQSIGFAIPIDTVKEVMPMLVLDQTERGWFGVKAVPLTLEKASELLYPDEWGILVVEVEKGSPAEKAGIRTHDIILELNGLSLKRFLLFRRKLLGLAPGHTVHLTIFRDGATMEVRSTLGRKGAKEESRKPHFNRHERGSAPEHSKETLLVRWTCSSPIPKKGNRPSSRRQIKRTPPAFS